jgi:hypothetical protein
MSRTNMSDYRCPQPWSDRGGETDRLGWVREAIQEGTNYLKLQRAYTSIDKAIDIMAGLDEDPIPKALSDIKVPRIRRQARELTSTLANLRPIFTFKTDNELFRVQTDILSKLTMSWWQQTRAARKFKAALQWSCYSTGYLSPTWEKSFWRSGKGDIDLKSYGPRDVLPIQMGRDHNLQKAYAVVICNEVPLHQAVTMFPNFTDRIKPDRTTPSWYSGMLGKVRQRTRAAFPRHLLDILGAPKEDASPSGPTVDLYNIYIMDNTMNLSDRPRTMGKTGTSWNYNVPYYGMDVPDTSLDAPLGATKKAGEEDCLLYPLRRLLTCTNDCILYDDTSFWWHGMVPIVKFVLDEWPDQYLGYSLIHDSYTIEKALNNNLRGYQDYVNKCLRPNLKYPPEGIAKGLIDRYDPRIPGQKIPVNTQMGMDITIEQMPPIPVNTVEFHELLKKEMDHVMAIPDMKELARANQIPSQETFEKLQEIAGPVVQDMSMGMEDSFIQLGEMVKGLIHQFYRGPRKVSLLGKDGVTEEDFQFDPQELIPTSLQEAAIPESPTKFLMPDNLERARRYMNMCTFQITPGSLHQITQTQRKMFLLQFWRDGRFPMDPQTVAEGFDMPNFGEIPGNNRTIFDRWKSWKEIETKMNIQVAMAQGQAQMQMQAQMGAPPGGPGGPPPEGERSEGRPPSAQKPPHFEQKDGGTRQTVSES